MTKRSAQERLDAIEPAIKWKEEFLGRLKAAEGDALLCADLMAESIEMKREANMLESVSRDGRVAMCIESVFASHCMLDARDAYLRARGSNSVPRPDQSNEAAAADA